MSHNYWYLLRETKPLLNITGDLESSHVCETRALYFLPTAVIKTRELSSIFSRQQTVTIVGKEGKT